jgi:hypothetical protein
MLCWFLLLYKVCHYCSLQGQERRCMYRKGLADFSASSFVRNVIVDFIDPEIVTYLGNLRHSTSQ